MKFVIRAKQPLVFEADSKLEAYLKFTEWMQNLLNESRPNELVVGCPLFDVFDVFENEKANPENLVTICNSKGISNIE